MNWYVQMESETDTAMTIAYSYGADDTCDGLLEYDKRRGDLRVKRISKNAGEGYTKMLFGPLYGCLKRKGLNGAKRRVCIG